MEPKMEELAAFLARAYDLGECRLFLADRGFYGKTFRLENGGNRYFVKLDGWPVHQKEYERSLTAVENINRAGLAFVPKLLLTREGRRCGWFDGGVIAVFEWVNGVHTEEYPLRLLFERLGTLYQRVEAPGEVGKDRFSTASYEQFCALRGMLWGEDEAERRALEVLAGEEKLFADRYERLRRFAKRCRGLTLPWVLTHGDAGGNCILHDGGLSIIDWDSARLAPPERDAWFFMHWEEQTREIEMAYAAAGFPYRLHPEVFAYYCYHSFFYYLCEHLQMVLAAPAEEKAARVQGLANFFPSWIWGQLAAADAVE